MHRNLSTPEALLLPFDFLIISHKFAEEILKYLLDLLNLGLVSELDPMLKLGFALKLASVSKLVTHHN